VSAASEADGRLATLTGETPDGDRVHECSAEDCQAWRYSRLALEFHHLREHSLAGRFFDE